MTLNLSVHKTFFYLESLDKETVGISIPFENPFHGIVQANVSEDPLFSVQIAALVGFFTFDNLNYINVVQNVQNVGHVESKPIFRIDKTLFIPLNNESSLEVIFKNFTRLEIIYPTNKRLLSKLDSIMKKNVLDLPPNIRLIENDKVDTPVTTTSPLEPVDVVQITKAGFQSSSSNFNIFKDTTFNLANEAKKAVYHSADQMDQKIQNSRETPNIISSFLKETSKKAKSALGPSTLGDVETTKDKILKELTLMLNSGIFFYGDTFDLTNNQQRKSKSTFEVDANKNCWFDFVDQRFMWNEAVLEPLISKRLFDFVTPIIQGFAQTSKVDTLREFFDFSLISRRSKYRAGLRYERRGCDDEGEAANFCETEQVIEIKNHTAATSDFTSPNNRHIISFVQTRGSIPLFWTQPSTALKPIPVLENKSEAEVEGVVLAHFGRQISLYDKVAVVNLVEVEGREAIVGGKFRKVLQKLELPKVQYFEFDFHGHCKAFSYENLSKLVDMVEEELCQIGFFWKNIQNQNGVIRTNCMDCLDRTNVVQSTLAKWITNKILLKLGIRATASDLFVEFPNLETAFKTLWAENGDHISYAYTGTAALKGDFTRTGKRNIQGLVNDASNSIGRLYYNNFKDNFRQKIIELFLGLTDYESIHQSINSKNALPLGQTGSIVAVGDIAVFEEDQISKNALLEQTESIINTVEDPNSESTLLSLEQTESIVGSVEDQNSKNTLLLKQTGLNGEKYKSIQR